MSTVLNIIIALLLIGVVVAFHEFGHFIIAKSRGITVTEFSIGMGPRLLSFVKGGTRYSLKLLPIGGSCAMGEDDTEATDDPHAFNNKNVWERIAVIFAGPFFNFILAFLFALIIVGSIGYDPAYVLSVTSGGQAESKGLQTYDTENNTYDIITKINGKRIVVGRDIMTYYYFHTLDGSPVTIEYCHVDENGNKTTNTIELTPARKYMLGFQYIAGDTGDAVIDAVTEGYPLEAAGIQAGDVITAINGTEIDGMAGLVEYLAENPVTEEDVTFTYLRDGVSTTVAVTPKLGDYYLDFSYNTSYRVKTSFLGVIRYSFHEVIYWIKATVGSLGQLFTGQLSSDDIGGPVRIVDEIGNVVDESKEDGAYYVFLNLLNWAILLSANLGVMNLLPIPALDGGRLLFLFIEVFRGKPINKEKEGMVHLIGIILLMILMVFVFFNDIRNVFFK